ncbi:Hypothetical predicted protein [Mytilus galloprovincialis]|uniref:Ig-like domain-containing protein n=1 Tax=Mytilus galloprovincialis TaxID=29158 RepID=A0A8B6DA89_MYTGA|nr:Hypothetical predicted protein [Mytilus galloprovincialis]
MNNMSIYSFALTKDIGIHIINTTAKHAGVYKLNQWLNYYPGLELKISNMSCPSRSRRQVCAVEGSSPTLNFLLDLHLYRAKSKEDILKRENFRTIRNYSLDLKIYNVTPEDEGDYQCYTRFYRTRVKLLVAKLWFENKTYLNTIDGQEGMELTITCKADTEQFITALKLESNETTVAIGDNQSVIYTFVPDRTNHLTKYQCMDKTKPSIMIEVQLTINYAPAVKIRYTNETIECDCDGVPAIYTTYQLDQLSTNGELIRSVNLNNKVFALSKEPFPYQRNGKYVCFVSNGIPSVNGLVLQTWSTNVKYEGPPVFPKENSNVKIGEIGQSITLSFYLYSYPDVEEIYIEKLGSDLTKNRKRNNFNILNYVLHYTEFDNQLGIHGYEILIEHMVLDFQVYRITAKNRLGSSDYEFEIKDNNNIPLSKSKRKYFATLYSISTVICVYFLIVHVCCFSKLIRTRFHKQHDEPENHHYHTYDEIETTSIRADNTVRSPNPNENHDQNLERQSLSASSNTVYEDVAPVEVIQNSFVNRLLQPEITEEPGQRILISSNDLDASKMDMSVVSSTAMPSTTNYQNCNQCNTNTNKEIPSDINSQISIDSDSCTSSYSMVGIGGDGYENPYEIVLQERQEMHKYTEITNERNSSISSTTSRCDDHEF